MTSCGILALPNELLYQIANELGSGGNTTNLRATCAHLNLILEPLVFSQTTLDTRRHHAILADIAENRTRAGSYVRKLRIPTLDSSARQCGCTMHEDSESWPKAHFESALRSLQGLTSISWTINADDPCWALESVIDCLSPLTTISSLSVYLKGDWSTPRIFPIRKICHFKHLQSCSIQVDDICLLLPITKAVIASNRPHLKRLQLDGGFADVDHGAFDTDLSKLFDELPAGSTSSITHLGLSKFLLGSAVDILPHFGSLQSLCLNSCVPVDFWSAFSGTGIYLKDVVVDYVNQAFVEYLESYTGLERISVSFNGIFVGVGRTDGFSERFYQSCVPQHRDSLKSVVIYPKTQGSWCFNANVAKQLRECRGLEELTVGVDLMDPNLVSSIVL
ncbi:hypothetical protein VNI00_019181 [Paramarasmius palmivorus]|uniref:F-box domain-containing protein n=1 Tax=Paramarasmius palmivorus TaxID=297713 RepID=A0AAW0AP95_9AGAR